MSTNENNVEDWFIPNLRVEQTLYHKSDKRKVSLKIKYWKFIKIHIRLDPCRNFYTWLS